MSQLRLSNAKLFTKTTLAVAILTSIAPMANAATDAEVAALRAEVAELKAMIQQQLQFTTTNTKNGSTPLNATGTPTSTIGSISGDQALQKFGGAVTAQTQPQGLKLTTSNGAEVELYGFLRGDGAYVLEGNDGVTNNIPSVGAPNTAGNTEDKFNATAQITRFGFNFKSNVGNDNKLAGKLEADFFNGQTNGSNNGALRVRHAFLTYNDWLMGQTKSTFLGYSPELIDSGTNVGTGTTRVPMVRYAHNLKPDTQLLVGLERGQSSGSVSTKYQMPALTARLNQNFHGKDGLVTVRGLVEKYDATRSAATAVAPVTVTDINGKPFVVQKGSPAVTAANDSVNSYGLGAGVNYKFNKMFEGFADVNYTKGNSNLVYGQTNAYTLDDQGNAQANEATSWMVGGVFNFSPKLRSNIGYSQVNFDDSSDYAKNAAIASGTTAASNEKLSSLWANLIYSPVKQVDLGIEYHDGERKTFNGKKFQDDRIGMMAAYKF